jgi:uncharacterized protein (DUF58 family)
MRRAASPRLRAYATFAAVVLLAALATGRPELVAIGAPFIAFLTVGLVVSRTPDVAVHVNVPRTRLLEGEPIPVEVTIACGSDAARVDVELWFPAGVSASGGSRSTRLRLRAGERRTFELGASADRWGTYALVRGRLRAWDPLGLLALDISIEPAGVVRVYPRPERLRALVGPRRTQTLIGSRVARVRGDGVEFADIRPFVAGDRVRRVNWRATARRGSLFVNERHPERNADVILFLDTFEEVRAAGAGTLDLVVRAAASLADGYLSCRDRVGVVGFGGVLHWLEPSLGSRAQYQIADALLQSEIVFSYVWKTVSVIPTRLLPAGCLIIGLSPLLDPRSVGALLDLRARGYDLAVLECSPEPFLAPPASPTEELARRLWRLERAALRSRFQQLGVAVGQWTDDEGITTALTEVIESRRHSRQPAPA